MVLTRAGEEPAAAPQEQDEPLPWGPIAAAAGVVAVLLLVARRGHR